VTALVLAVALSAAAPCDAPWPHYERYRDAFVSPDGRVIDRTDGDRTTSEGQAYGMFFALVANDRATFDRLLRWTRDNLADGDLARHLPAWKWGRAGRGEWQVLDRNPASDADVWMAYALLEAARLWKEPKYDALARAIAAQVVAREVAVLPGLGPMLLPAPEGFALKGRRGWRLNPSYLAPQPLRRLASAGVPGPWDGVVQSSSRLLRETARRGFVADWVAYAPGRGFGPDPVLGPFGSYDAIRTYLWIGMLPPDDPLRRELQPIADGPLRSLSARGELGEKVDLRTGEGRGAAPVGFYAALLPLAQTAGTPAVVNIIEERLTGAARDGLYGSPPAYYDQNLVLFGRGFAEGRYRFGGDGRLAPAWETACGTPSR
jgi:endoglucanase